jgi:hypothetical protein
MQDSMILFGVLLLLRLCFFLFGIPARQLIRDWRVVPCCDFPQQHLPKYGKDLLVNVVVSFLFTVIELNQKVNVCISMILLVLVSIVISTFCSLNCLELKLHPTH